MDNFSKIAASIIPSIKNDPEKTTVKIIPSNKSGWDDIKIKDSSIYDKKPSDYNMKDLQWYCKKLYSSKYGVPLHIPIAIGYTWLNSIKFAISKRVGYDVENIEVKEYFDYCFKKHVDSIIRNEGNFSLYKLTKPKYILDYVDSNMTKKQNKCEETVEKIVDNNDVNDNILFTTKDLNAAYKIGYKFMLTNYGVIIPHNFITKIKNKETADKYIKNALDKLKEKDEIENVILATKKYQPYPSWIDTTIASSINITVTVGENSVFSDLNN